MRHPIAIEIGTETTAYGVVAPDLPGCFSAGDTIDDAVSAAEKAAAAWIDATLDAGGTVPAASFDRGVARATGLYRLSIRRHYRGSGSARQFHRTVNITLLTKHA